MNLVHIIGVALVGAISVSCQDHQSSHRVVDCAYNSWSEFRPSSVPGKVVRTREVIRWPSNGGKPCTGNTYEYRNATDLQTPSLSKFLSMFIPGDRQTFVIKENHLNRGQVPQKYTLSRDIALVIDTTLFHSAVPLYKSLLSNLVGSVCGDIGTQQSNNIFTLITYDSNGVSVIHSFNSPQTKAAIQNKILGIQSTNGGSAPSLLKRAMNRASGELTSFDSGTRPYNLAHKETVLFVTYRSWCENGADLANDKLKVNSRVYVVVLGQSGDGTQPPSDWCLRKYASSQFDFHFLWVKDYDELKDFASWTLDITSYYNPCQNTPPHLPGSF